MSRRVSVPHLAIELSLAVMLGVAVAIAAKAASPTEGSAPAAGRAAAALETAAKDNKYLFIFFFDKEDSHTNAMKAVLRSGGGKDERPGRFDSGQHRGPRRKADRG